MSGNIITADNLVVAGNIAVGGFIVQGTSLSDGNVNVGSITISGIQLEVVTLDNGVALNLSGSNLVSLNICGEPFGGWVGEATGALNMNGYNILNVNRISGSDGLLIFDTSQVIRFTNDFENNQEGTVVINPSYSFVRIGTGNTAPTIADERLYVGGSTIITGSCAIGIDSLSGALNVSGDVYVSGSVYTASQSVYIGDIKISQSGTGLDFGSATSITLSGNVKQPFIQYGNSTIINGSETVNLPKTYSDIEYTVLASVYTVNNSGFFIEKTDSNAFRIEANDLTEAWSFGWTTFGSVEQPPST